MLRDTQEGYQEYLQLATWYEQQVEPGNWLHWLHEGEHATCDHNYVDNGSTASGNGAQEHFICTRCGHSIDHIYF